ncbi:MAG TPA: hypothetical protein VFW44_11520 [Bryobacteraceae bacterium]|nr:hypothetical protein [Bryobacteraceae bacterium]
MFALRSIRRWLALVILAAPAFADCCNNSIAVIAQLSGKATVRAPGARALKTAAALDWLGDGETLEVAPRSQAVLILVNGHRYELSAGATLTVAANAAPKITGTARELPALPPIPRLAAVAAESAPTSGAGALRGGGAMTGLYPRAGTLALAEKVNLRYAAVPKTESYHVSLENETGMVLLNVTTESTEVPVDSAALQAGTRYSWRVRALRSGTEIAAGTEEFTTLSAENSLRREEFASALGASPSSLAVIADVDLRLGLISEACDEFTEALKQKPDDAVLRQALESARSTLAGKAH